MGKRDTYRDEPDWDIVSQAYERERHERHMRELMTPERGITVDECRWGRTS